MENEYSKKHVCPLSLKKYKNLTIDEMGRYAKNYDGGISGVGCVCSVIRGETGINPNKFLEESDVHILFQIQKTGLWSLPQLWSKPGDWRGSDCL